jgi:hypothetical protein
MTARSVELEEAHGGDGEGLAGRGGVASKLGRVIAAILVLIGGVTVAVGTLLTWLQLTVAGISFSSGIFVTGAARGTELSYGIAALVAGGVLAFVGLLGLTFRRARWLSVAAILVALISAGIALYVFITIESRFAEYAAAVADTDDPVALRQRVEAFFRVGSLDVNPETGLYAVLVGSSVSLVGGVVRIVSRRRGPAPVSERRDIGVKEEEPGTGGEGTKSDSSTRTGSTFGFPPGSSRQ